MRKQKMDIGRAGAEDVVDYQHKSMTRLNILPEGLEVRGRSPGRNRSK